MILLKKVLGLVFLLSLIGYGLWQAVLPSEVEAGVSIGNKAPDFELETLSGEVMSLSSLEGKNVLLNFWASWCPPCKAEMPDMQKFYENNKDDIVVVGINLTTSEPSIDEVKKFVDDYGLTFPVLLDKKDQVGGKMYQVLSIPTSYFIDSEGIIRNKFVGAMSYETMEKFANELK